MSRTRRAAFVTLLSLVQKRFPEVDDPGRVIDRGEVLVDGSVVSNPRALVRAEAAVRWRPDKLLRGTHKLRYALNAFEVDTAGGVALDVGAAAGGFTQALLEAGVARLYAVDAGVGQLRGWLRADSRVVNLERTNLADLDPVLIDEPLDVVALDLSYLSIADALPQLVRVPIRPGAHLLALVKPTFELHAGRLAASAGDVEEAVGLVRTALRVHRWCFTGTVNSPLTGARGAIEVFVHALSP
jgi:23S rRNA (cytidine1920-2'-O)/16S rRNA (cytidine1409-2'-O)-methyltransferase